MKALWPECLTANVCRLGLDEMLEPSQKLASPQNTPIQGRRFRRESLVMPAHDAAKRSICGVVVQPVGVDYGMGNAVLAIGGAKDELRDNAGILETGGADQVQ